MASQESFFLEYCKRHELELVKIYADEGKSGTKLKNRTQLLQLLKDGEKNKFEQVLIKDVSRLARNTVDFLTSIRKLRNRGIEVIFVNYDKTSSQSSEFMLTMLSAIAQEESSNTSKRVKFGKEQNAKKGRVPNFIYGYDKVPNNYFVLSVNDKEAKIVKTIFELYVENEYGTNRIAKYLNYNQILTKRECQWTQTGVVRVLKNEIYIGRIINGKEEVEDFLSGRRIKREEEKRYITVNKSLQIIDDDLFFKANRRLTKTRKDAEISNIRESKNHTFTKLIYCGHCNGAYRRLVRTYKNVKIKWVCSKRNAEGSSACINTNTVNEEELLNQICEYLFKILSITNEKKTMLLKEIESEYSVLSDMDLSVKDCQNSIAKLYKKKQKYLTLFENDVIELEALKKELKAIEKDIDQLEEQMTCYHLYDFEEKDRLFNHIYQEVKSKLSTDKYYLKEFINNDNLKICIDKILVDTDDIIRVIFKKSNT